MNEKKLKELLEKLDINHPMAQVLRNILAQYTAIKQTKIVIKSFIEQYKIEQLYDDVMKEDKE